MSVTRRRGAMSQIKTAEEQLVYQFPLVNYNTYQRLGIDQTRGILYQVNLNTNAVDKLNLRTFDLTPTFIKSYLATRFVTAITHNPYKDELLVCIDQRAQPVQVHNAVTGAKLGQFGLYDYVGITYYRDGKYYVGNYAGTVDVYLDDWAPATETTPAKDATLVGKVDLAGSSICRGLFIHERRVVIFGDSDSKLHYFDRFDNPLPAVATDPAILLQGTGMIVVTPNGYYCISESNTSGTGRTGFAVYDSLGGQEIGRFVTHSPVAGIGYYNGSIYATAINGRLYKVTPQNFSF